MEGAYPVMLGKEEIGQAQVIRQGLYYQIRCRCKLTGEVMHRLVLIAEDQEENLGIPAPEGAWFCLTKRLPVSRISGRILHIHARPRSAVLRESFIPLKPEEPFLYLQRLRDARLAEQDGQLGVILK